MKTLRAKMFSLKPDIPFRSGTLTARCQTSWLTLFAHLYDAGRDAATYDIVLWEVQETGAVRVTPRSSAVLETAKMCGVPEILFRIDGIRRALKRAASAARRKAVLAEYTQWVQWAIVESFVSEKVEIEYSYFNEEEHGFSAVVTPQDLGLNTSDLQLLIGDFGGLDDQEIRRKQNCLATGSRFRLGRRERRKRILNVKRKPAPRKPVTQPLETFGPGWKRFYFDDGKTRRFWHIKTRGKDQTIVQGPMGSRGTVRRKSFPSPKAARDHATITCQAKLDDGFIAYAPDGVAYARKNRRALKLIRRAMKEFEKRNDYGIPPQYRRYILAVNGGTLRKHWYIHLEGNSHTTRYARLGGRPGETTKTFGSAEDAAHSAAKLRRQKLKKGYTEIIPEMLFIERPPGLKRATESAIRKLEKHLGTNLPDEYRRFLKTQNGGQPDPHFIRIPGVPHIDNVDVGFLYGHYPKKRPGESLSWGIEVNGAVLPKGHLPIAYGSDIFTLSLQRNRGCVYFWDHESDDINENTEKFRNTAGHLLAHSFDEFLTRIALFQQSGDEVNGRQPSSRFWS